MPVSEAAIMVGPHKDIVLVPAVFKLKRSVLTFLKIESDLIYLPTLALGSYTPVKIILYEIHLSNVTASYA